MNRMPIRSASPRCGCYGTDQPPVPANRGFFRGPNVRALFVGSKSNRRSRIGQNETATQNSGRNRSKARLMDYAEFLKRSRRGGWGIRTPEGFHPTRFPSVRHRPLGESSTAMEDLLDQRNSHPNDKLWGGSSRGTNSANSPRTET